MITASLCWLVNRLNRRQQLAPGHVRPIIWCVGAFTLPFDILMILTLLARFDLIPVQ